MFIFTQYNHLCIKLRNDIKILHLLLQYFLRKNQITNPLAIGSNCFWFVFLENGVFVLFKVVLLPILWKHLTLGVFQSILSTVHSRQSASDTAYWVLSTADLFFDNISPTGIITHKIGSKTKKTNVFLMHYFVNREPQSGCN